MASLIVCGSGIRGGTQITSETRSAIAAADKVFFVVPDPLAEMAIRRHASDAIDLSDQYSPEMPRHKTYQRMVDIVMVEVDAGADVCIVFYGHPGVFVDPGPEMIRRARKAGVKCEMFPGISAADALYADLLVDPGREGVQMFSATDFLIRRRVIDTTVPLILWQMGAIGQEYGADEPETRHLGILRDRLLEDYPPSHELVMYEAAGIIGYEPTINRVALDDLHGAPLTRATTMYVPPTHSPDVDTDMSDLLGVVID